MRAKRNRIIIDTNLWISYLLTKKFSKLDQILKSRGTTLLFSTELLDEFLTVANRPKFKNYFLVEDLNALLEQISREAEFIQIKSEVKICRDPKDNFLLSLAKDGKANYLITGDKDLTSIHTFEKTRILTMAEFFPVVK